MTGHCILQAYSCRAGPLKYSPNNYSHENISHKVMYKEHEDNIAYDLIRSLIRARFLVKAIP